MQKFENKSRTRMLAMTAVIAMALCVLAAIVPDDADATGASATSITADDFLELDTDGDGVIDLDGDYVLTNTVNVTSSLTIIMNGHSLSITNNDMFIVNGDAGSTIDFKIVGDAYSKMIVYTTTENTIYSVVADVSGNMADINYEIDGGYYEACYVFSVGNDNSHFGGSFSIENASVKAVSVPYEDYGGVSEGIWVSYGGMESATITNTTIVSEGLGIYLGVVENATLTNVKVTAVDTALEIKSGNVTVSGGSYTSDSYLSSTGGIGMSESGSGVNTVCINNGYSRQNTGSAVVVTFENDVSLYNTSVDSGTFVQVTAGLKEVRDQWVPCTDPITVNGLSPDEMEIFRASGSSTNTITVNGPEGPGKDVVTEVPGLVETDTIVVITETVTMDVQIDEGKSLEIRTAGDTTYSGRVVIGNDSITVSGMKGSFTFHKGSVYLSGDIADGLITLVDGDVLKLEGTIADLTINFTGSRGADVIVEEGKMVTVTGTMYMASGIEMTNNGTITNQGIIINHGDIVNDGEIVNDGSLRGDGTVDNTFGYISGSGTIDNEVIQPDWSGDDYPVTVPEQPESDDDSEIAVIVAAAAAAAVLMCVFVLMGRGKI